MHPSRSLHSTSERSADVDDLLVRIVRETSFSNYYIVATWAWLVYDHLLTLSQEARYMWCKPLSSVSLLFYINRYGALALRALVVAQGMLDLGSEQSSLITGDKMYVHRGYSLTIPLRHALRRHSCGGLLRAIEALSLLLEVNLIVILAFRIYAIWASRKVMAYLVLLMGLAQAGLVVFADIHTVSYAWKYPATGCAAYNGLGRTQTGTYVFIHMSYVADFDEGTDSAME
ncbi:hypothetical protein PsYK624_011290 [Phanerochaete sordida]|uniref:DUF6533 domain-containing protein n=1 Tax=Phanerochaete sordida TaxID=48140 RepID=A0A9P3FYV9_9APHY|nr:hypothetical protein PsYK624_011290 [Phanerochaete sordida]